MQLPTSWMTFAVLALAATPTLLVNAAPVPTSSTDVSAAPTPTPPTEIEALKGMLGKRHHSAPLAIRAESPSSEQPADIQAHPPTVVKLSSEQTADIQVHPTTVAKLSTLVARSPEPEPLPGFEELEKRFGFLKAAGWAIKGVKAVAGMFSNKQQ